MRKLDIRLLRMIKASKGQFISIAVVIILALTIYISFSMTFDNLNNTIDSYYDITNYGDVFVEVVRIPKAAIDQLYTIEGISMAQGRVMVDVPLKVENPNEKVRVRVVSIPKEEKPINKLFTIEGREVKKQIKATAMLRQFAEARGIGIGDKITPYIAGREYPLDVIGIVGSPEYIYLMENEQSILPAPEKFGVIYVGEDFAQSVFGYQGSYNQIMIKVDDESLYKIDTIIDEIEDQLDRYGVERIIKRDDQLSHKMMMEELDSLDKMSTAVPVLFLIVAGVIINIMLSRTVKNDRMAIGVMKALGYNNIQILQHYIKYSLSIGLIGSIFSIVFSIMLSRVFTNVYMQYMNIPIMRTEVYFIYIIYGVIFTSIFCILSGLMGARNVLRILPADSMRPEAPKIGKRVFLERIKPIWSKLTFSWKIVIRNIMRNKRRALFLIIGIALTYSITMVPIFMSYVFSDLFAIHYGEFQTMDFNIDFSKPMNNNGIKELSKVIDIEHIEPKLEFPFELNRGWRKKVVSVIGLNTNTEVYNFTSPQDESFTLSQEGIVLSEGLADSLKIKIGDEIILKNFLPNKEDTKIQVTGITQQYLGLNAYMNIEAMGKIIGEKGMITGALVNSSDDVTAKLNNVANINNIQSVEDMKNSFLEFMDMIIYSVGLLMLFGGILGFAIVYNVTIISISERLMEFSSLRVLGFDKNEIYKMITRENGLLTLLGIIIGIPVAYGMCYGIATAFDTDIFSIPVNITPISYIITAIATIIFVTVAQLATIRRIYKLNFIDALKSRIS
ncbi:FtsX-like permease family protein [Alkaliphilus pronyensis]|uniref:FtsX-like permease family protein n=1 Tax=Alkaliphilus pronyensis TaxID=1482732 RepID=A0A6I0FC30_9FIRM|nr:FtsX-like permease family protein [Alkaliphilus pronyensis]KAB3535515.1 FtsX-like permease family protein [Alkaliphilus pronyensis]